MAIFPDKPLRTGDKWTIKGRDATMNLSITSAYQLAEIAPEYVLIKGTAMVDSPDEITYQKGKAGLTSLELKGSIISKFKADRTTGWIVEAKVSQVSKGVVHIVGENGGQYPVVIIKEEIFSNRR
jgi:hypothetical protein